MHIHSPRVFFKYEPTKLNTSICGPSVTQEAPKKMFISTCPRFCRVKKKKKNVWYRRSTERQTVANVSFAWLIPNREKQGRWYVAITRVKKWYEKQTDSTRGCHRQVTLLRVSALRTCPIRCLGWRSCEFYSQPCVDALRCRRWNPRRTVEKVSRRVTVAGITEGASRRYEQVSVARQVQRGFPWLDSTRLAGLF